MLPKAVPAAKLPDDVFKFIFVRHPLRRLVSAFVNKFITAREKAFIRELQKFLWLRASNNTAKNKTRSAGQETIEEPTLDFSGFVDFVLHEAKRGRISYGTLHWIPYYTVCNICDIRLVINSSYKGLSSLLHYSSAV